MNKRHRTHTRTQACTLTLSHTRARTHTYKFTLNQFFWRFSFHFHDVVDCCALCSSLSLARTQLRCGLLPALASLSLSRSLPLCCSPNGRALCSLALSLARTQPEKYHYYCALCVCVYVSVCVCVCSVLDSRCLCAWDALRERGSAAVPWRVG